MVNALQKKHGAAPLEGWKEPPPVGSAVKVPKGDSVPDALAKDDDHWRIIVRSAEILLHPHSLEGMSLGEFGARIEYGIHAAMHLRFGDLGTNGRLRPFIRNIFRDVSTKFDEPEYDSLLDWYSAHVHPLFWKIHGWIDDRIGDWETVNRSRIDMCAVWMGPMEHHHHHAITLAEEQALVDSMEEGVRTLIDSGISGMIRQLL
ncbi:MAG: hypothetical protein VYC34_12175 [Planctomycetota bacterium]|nr:hypothetical protein [Planctomycetota bacterium]